MFRSNLLVNLFIHAIVSHILIAEIRGDGYVNKPKSNDKPFIKEAGRCTMYGQCALRNDKALNCLYNEPAPLLNNTEALNLMVELCPDLYNGTSTRTCCDLAQLKNIQDNIQVPFQMLSRCPSCFSNFIAQFCEMTCSPNQSLFVAPETTGHGNSSVENIVTPTNRTYIETLAFNMTDKYAESMFDSCKNVTSPATNAPALSVLCPYESCTAQQWITYMNSLSNGYAPFQIDVSFESENNSYAMNYKTTACNDTSGRGKCSCSDCPASCSGPAPCPPEPAEPWTIFGKDGYIVVMGIVFAVFTFLFLTFELLKWCCTRKQRYSVLGDDVIHHGSLNDVDDDLGVRDHDISGRCFEGFGLKLERLMQDVFRWWGVFCANHPWVVIIAGVIFVAVCSCGVIFITITTDPVELWSSPDSKARQDKNYYDSHFGPFYRTEQLIITAPNATGTNYSVYQLNPEAPPKYQWFGPIFDEDIMLEILDLQLAIQGIVAYDEDSKVNVALKDICFSPLSPYNDNCTIMSPLNYFQNDLNVFNKSIEDFFGNPIIGFRDHIMACTSGPTAVDDATQLHESCLGSYGGPVFPWVALGGYEGKNYLNATAAVITFSVNNYYNNTEKLNKALAWEKKYLEFMKEYEKRSDKNLSISYSAERSIEDEIDRESSADIMTILASYLIMFAYIAIALGKIPSCATLFIECKLTVGLCGVLIVLCSVGVSLGIFSYLGLPLTLIVTEVVPFLVLAVGVDNIFILVQHYQRDTVKHEESHSERMGRILSAVAPTMFMSSMSESLAFFLGGLSTMPAVRTFSLVAGLAVLTDFLLQITVFVAILSLDAKREKSHRYDCCCCIQDTKATPNESIGLLHSFMRSYFSPVVLSSCMRPFLVIIFFGMACFSGAVLHKVEIGLDQSLSMPSDSYVLNYFADMNKYLSVGAPVYFVVPDGYDYKDPDMWDGLCSGIGCNEHSLTTQISFAAQMPQYSHIATEASSWIDDYFSWLTPQSSCCRYYDDDKNLFCNATITNASCASCRSAIEANKQPRPSVDEFFQFMPWYLNDNPEIKCAKGGHAAYASGVKLTDNNTNIGATYFMAYHTIARNSTDFIGCYQRALDLSSNITQVLNTTEEVFPYSVFYVFYEQYLTIVHDTLFNLGISMAAIFVIVFLLLGLDIKSALIVVLTISLIILDMFGVMFLWDIPLNAVSLVNLVMAVGISVEFCSHVTRAFAISQERTKLLRAKEALAEMGSSVLSGITLTKFVGIAILAFSKSQIFRVFYFKMYLSIVILGALHGLILLPIILSVFGPQRRRVMQIDFSSVEEEDNSYKVVDSQPNSSSIRS